MSTIRLTLVPAKTSGRFMAMLDGKLLVTSSQPLYSGARVLLAEGVDPETVLEAQHQGSPTVAMRSTVGEAAKWTVTETDERGLQRRLWTPHPMAVSRERQELENEREAAGRTIGASEP